MPYDRASQATAAAPDPPPARLSKPFRMPLAPELLIPKLDGPHANPTKLSKALADSGLTKPGLCYALVQYWQLHRWLHLEIVQKGQFEFLFQALQHNPFGLSQFELGWVWRQLQATAPTPDCDLPDGTVLDEYGNIVLPDDRDVPVVEAVQAGPTRTYST